VIGDRFAPLYSYFGRSCLPSPGNRGVSFRYPPECIHAGLAPGSSGIFFLITQAIRHPYKGQTTSRVGMLTSTTNISIGRPNRQ